MFFTRTDRQESLAPAPHPGRAAPHPALADLLAVEDVLLDCDAATRDSAFAGIASALAAHHGLREPAVVAALAEREQLGSTALGQGVAIPHARLSGLRHAIAAFVRLRAAIPFDAPDGKPVSTLLILLVPEGATNAHLELLAEAANLFCDKAFRDRLNRCDTASEVLAAVSGAPPT
jgi:PTS system nitrogen regulatory IIA component